MSDTNNTSPQGDKPQVPAAPPSSSASARAEVVDGLKRGALFGLVAAAVGLPVIHFTRRSGNSEASPQAAAQDPMRPPRFASFGGIEPSPDARHIADWVADSRDNQSTEFVIVDKKFAHVYVFDADAKLIGDTPVLLGNAPGDLSAEGVGKKKLADIPEHERTTPAGRFLAQRGLNLTGEDVVWVDYDAAVSMHRVRTSNANEKRLERLATPTIDDNRISAGCINMPVAFFEGTIRPIFLRTRALVYVLPEELPVRQVFNSYDVAARAASFAPQRPVQRPRVMT